MGVSLCSIPYVSVSLCRIKSRCSWRSTRAVVPELGGGVLGRGWCEYTLYLGGTRCVAQCSESTHQLISFVRARHHTGLWCVVQGRGGICDCEAGVAQGADQDDECEHMCVFNLQVLPLDVVTEPSGLYHWI